MDTILLVHIAAGGAGLVSGFIALYAAKGAPLHRQAGVVFVCTMLAMCGAGLIVTVFRGIALATNVPASLLTASMVVTALTAVRPATVTTRALDRVAFAVTVGVALASLNFALEAVANGGVRNGMPAFPFFLFGITASLAVLGDYRIMRRGPLAGAARIARHLWRMTYALLLASLSFFLGQAGVFPERFRIMPLLALPVLAVLLTLLYWLWRVRIRRTLRGLVRIVVADPV